MHAEVKMTRRSSAHEKVEGDLGAPSGAAPGDARPERGQAPRAGQTRLESRIPPRAPPEMNLLPPDNSHANHPRPFGRVQWFTVLAIVSSVVFFIAAAGLGPSGHRMGLVLRLAALACLFAANIGVHSSRSPAGRLYAVCKILLCAALAYNIFIW
jgi:hypothetical protein